MQHLLDAVLSIVSNTPPEKAAQLADLLRGCRSQKDLHILSEWPATSGAKARLETLITKWQQTNVSSAELAAILTGASTGYHRAKIEEQVELVWTGPSSGLIATRKTEQALLEVIRSSKAELFITSFVVYNIPALMKELTAAVDRNVRVSMLLEASDVDGGSVTLNGIRAMRSALPTAHVLSWVKKTDDFIGGKVHAKIAVADDFFCFVSSANLTGHAMEKNMEAGVLIKGGAVPSALHRHLKALETARIIARV